MIQRSLIFLLTLFLGATVMPARGQGVSGVLNDQFRTMSTTTAPGVYMGTRRGVITGGSLHMRANVMRPGPLIQLTPPSLRTGGCGDVDLMGGSFSFISGEEMTQLLRNIASNAATYAFQLALGSMCASCSKVMGDMQDKVQEMNQYLGDSCQAAQFLVDKTGLKAWSDERKALQSVGDSTSLDNLSSKKQGPGKDSVTTELSDQALKDLDPGNLIWRMLKSQNFGSWTVGSSTTDDLLMDLMSYTGTMIVCTDSRNDCRRSEETQVREGNTVQTPVPAILSLEDLIEGSGRMRGDLAAKNVTVYRCVGDFSDAGGCLNVSPMELSNFEGVAQKVLNIVTGGPLGPTNSMIGRIRAGADPTQEDLALMTNARGYTSMIVNLAKRSEYAAIKFAENYANEIALEIAKNTMEQMLQSARRTALSLEGGNASEAMKILDETRVRLFNEAQALKRGNEASATMLQYYINLMQMMAPAEIPPIPGASDAPTA